MSFFGSFEVPDRITALQTLSELNPARKWNLVLVNISFTIFNYFMTNITRLM